MPGYSPLKITGYQTGLVQERENFLLPNDAYPILQNAYVWREKLLRKSGCQLLGRLQRLINSSATYGAIRIQLDGSGNANLITGYSLEPGSNISIGVVFIDTTTLVTYTDPQQDGTLSPSGTINYATGDISIAAAAGHKLAVTFYYSPNLPVMGIRTQELSDSANDNTIFFDQKYAYVFNTSINAFQEYIPVKTWNAHGADTSGTDFFYSTNYWVSDPTNFPGGTPNSKLFWVTNNTGQFLALADPVRITDGTSWLDFSPPTYGQIDATNFVVQWLCMLPFRGRLVVFNTWEGSGYGAAINYRNRIRWSTIGNPFIPFAAGPPATGSWRDDIRGQGGFLDIPTSEDIIAVGFVRDNLVIYCERSTWQLRYTGRSIAPFQIERVNSELGAESTFSAIQFDTSLLGIGDKGIVECDSYKSDRIDIKIPDLVFSFQSANDAVARVQGIRDFINRLAFWTFVSSNNTVGIFPDQRLVYNYENDSWAIFNDSLTCLGTYQPTDSRTWLNTALTWKQCNFSWIGEVDAEDPAILGGNQQGFVEFLDQTTTNDVTLYIQGITAHTTTATSINSPNHNLETGFVVEFSGIIGTFSSLNGGVFGIVVTDADNFVLYTYDPITDQFSEPQLDASGTYLGGGLISIRENFYITSKKFNFLDEGQNIQIGYVDILMQAVPSTIETSGTVGNTDIDGNFLGILSSLLGLPTTASIEPGSFTAIVGSYTYTEAYPYSGLLLSNGMPAALGTFLNYDTTSLGLVTGQITTPVYVSFNYYPGTPEAEIAMNMYLDYNDIEASNTVAENDLNDTSQYPDADPFFNSIIPTSSSNLNNKGGTKFWQRVYCPTRSNFLTIQYTFNNAQMAYGAQKKDVQIDAQVIWLRKAGRMCQI